MVEDKRARLGVVWRQFVQSPEGATIMADLGDKFGFECSSTHSPGSTEIDLAFREGQRSVVCYIKRLLLTKPQQAQEPAQVAGDFGPSQAEVLFDD